MRTGLRAVLAAVILVLVAACAGGPGDVEEPAPPPDPVDTWCSRWADAVDALAEASPDGAVPPIDAVIDVARDGDGLDQVDDLVDVVVSTWPAEQRWTDAVGELYRVCTTEMRT